MFHTVNPIVIVKNNSSMTKYTIAGKHNHMVNEIIYMDKKVNPQNNNK